MNESQLKTLCRCARVIAESAYNRDDGAATVPLVLRAGGLQVSGRLPAEHAARVGRSVCRSLGRAATGGNGRRRRRPAAKKRGARP